MSILILSYPGDFHAAVVEWTLKKKYGLDVTTIFAPNFPNIDTYSAYLHSSERGTASAELLHNAGRLTPKVVWRRRLPPPSRAIHAHANDIDFVSRENRSFVEGCWSLLSSEAFWVNDHLNAVRANSKAYQLRTASQTGWLIPDTLMSNDPDEIRDFVRDEPSIYKPFMPAVWKANSGSTFSPMTAKVGLEQLSNDDQLRACAGIFQRLIGKAYELRITIFGRTCIAMKVHSQQNPDTELDWRVGFYNGIQIEHVELTTAVRDACFALMDRLGLVFGAIDVAVTQDGQYYFFEVNEMGQFLWVEDMCADVPMLGAFCGFLASADPGYQHSENASMWSMDEARKDAEFMEYFKLRQVGNAEFLPGYFCDERADANA
jgi:glutathione synthase/RimK-type ligase-like ATP-grasp enzyme